MERASSPSLSLSLTPPLTSKCTRALLSWFGGISTSLGGKLGDSQWNKPPSIFCDRLADMGAAAAALGAEAEICRCQKFQKRPEKRVAEKRPTAKSTLEVCKHDKET
jgi:hypothetical protein